MSQTPRLFRPLTKEELEGIAAVRWRQLCAQQAMDKLAWLKFYGDLLRTAAGPYIAD